MAEDFGTVSVVVPAYNAEKYIGRAIESLLGQSYPKEKTELIFVNNNSSDKTAEVIKSYPVVYLEKNDKQSSYAARNKGIKHSNSEMIAFTDADCIADKDWLKNGICKLKETRADLVGGKVDFILSSNTSAAEIYDTLTHFGFNKKIKKGHGTGAGNLFTYADCFEKNGLFSEVVSGGDLEWSMRAVRNGLRLEYAEDAVVRHPARKLKEILFKSFRTGTGKPGIRLSNGQSFWHEVGFHSLCLLPVKLDFSHLKKKIDDNDGVYSQMKVRILIIGFLCAYMSRLGAFCGMLKICFKRITETFKNR